MTSLILDESTAGALVTVELLCTGVIALAIAPWLTGSRKRGAALIAAWLILGGQIGAAACSSLPWMFVWLAVLGFGIGLMLAAVNAIIASTAAPDRLFGLSFMAAYAVTALLVLGLAPAIAHAGHAGAYAALAGFTLLALPLLQLLPHDDRVENHTAIPEAWLSGALLLCGTAVIGAAMMGFYAYIERLGVKNGLSLATIAKIFALQQIASVLGAALAATQGVSFGLMRSLLIGIVCHTAAVMTAVFGDSLLWFAIGVIAEGLTFLFVLPLLFTLAARIDSSGRWPAAANGAFFISTAIAPFAYGGLIERYDYDVIGWMMLATTPLGVTAFALADRCVRSRNVNLGSARQ